MAAHTAFPRPHACAPKANGDTPPASVGASPRRAAWATILAVSTWPLGLHAQTPPSTVPFTATSLTPGAGQPRAPLWVVVESARSDVAPETVSAAVAKELGMPLAQDPERARTRVRVIITDTQAVLVEVTGDTLPSAQRRVRAPRDPAEVVEVATLLSANLARDESQGLLASFTREPEAPGTDLQGATAAPLQPAEPVDPSFAPLHVHASLWEPLSTGSTEGKQVSLELGLFFGHINALSGLAVTPGVTRVDNYARGAQLASVGNLTGGHAEGLRLAGAFNFGEKGVEGLTGAGVVDIERGALVGIQAAGAFAQSGPVSGLQGSGVVTVANEFVGLQAAGVFTMADRFEGLQGSGAVALADDFVGLQTAGIFTMADRFEGLQASGGVALADDLSGAQLSVVNIARDVTGLQAGIVNIARDVEGTQLGVVNIARRVRGASLGLVAYEKEGRTQLVSAYSGTLPASVGVRFVSTSGLYVMPSLVYEPTGATEYVGAGLALGYRLRLRPVFVDFEANSISTRLNTNVAGADAGLRFEDRDNVDLHYHATVGFELTPWLGLFAGGGVRHRAVSVDNQGEGVKPEAVAGIQFF